MTDRRTRWAVVVAGTCLAGCGAPQVPTQAPDAGPEEQGAEDEVATLSAVVALPGRRVAAGMSYGLVVDDERRLLRWRPAPILDLDGAGGGRAPEPVPGMEGVVEVAGSATDACAVLTDGTVRCWGEGFDGEAPAGPESGEGMPPPVAGLAATAHVSVGGLGVCAVRRDGALLCRGSPGIGGRGGEALAAGATRVQLVEPVIQVSVGGDEVCAVRVGGQVACWRSGDPPAAVAGVEGAVGVAVGMGFACAALRSGGVRCWGEGTTGQLGDGETRSSATAVAVSGIDDAAQVAVWGGGRLPGLACALRRSGVVSCWGRLVGAGSGSASPVEVEGVTGALDLAVGEEICVRHEGAAITCWQSGVAPDGAAPGLWSAP